MKKLYGTLDIDDAALYVGDPTCKADQVLRIWMVPNIKLGRYHCYADTQYYIEAGDKFTGISIIHIEDEEKISNPRFAMRYKEIYHKDILTKSGFVGFLYGEPKTYRKQRDGLDKKIATSILFDYFGNQYFCVQVLFKTKGFYPVHIVSNRYGEIVGINIYFLEQE